MKIVLQAIRTGRKLETARRQVECSVGPRCGSCYWRAISTSMQTRFLQQAAKVLRGLRLGLACELPHFGRAHSSPLPDTDTTCLSSLGPYLALPRLLAFSAEYLLLEHRNIPVVSDRTISADPKCSLMCSSLIVLYGAVGSPTAQLTRVFPNNLCEVCIDCPALARKSPLKHRVVKIIIVYFTIPNLLKCISVLQSRQNRGRADLRKSSC